jgi:hypothetical protein
MGDLSRLFTDAVAGIHRDRARNLDAQEQIALGQRPGAPPQEEPAASGQGAFFKGYTPEERARQQAKLAEALRRRQ